MSIYIEEVLLLNFLIDLLLLITISIVLKRRVRIIRLFLGAILGSVTLLFLFVKVSSLVLFLFKIVIAILMVIIGLGYKNIRYTLTNLLYLYLVSIIYGGFVYFLEIEFAYKNNGLIFYNDGLSFNFIIILLISPIILIFYIKSNRKIKNNNSNYYDISIDYKGIKKELTGFLDTGNNLYDPYLKRPIMLIKKGIIDFNGKYILISYSGVNGSSLLKCYKVDKIMINNNCFKNVLMGEIDDINIEGIDVILHSYFIERG